MLLAYVVLLTVCLVPMRHTGGCWLADREYECDHGFMGGPDGLCVPYKPTFDADAPAGGPCGKGGEPVCSGNQMAGALHKPLLPRVVALC